MKKILIIEDNLDIQENTAELLELSGYEVVRVSNGFDGVDIASSILPDVILCDIQMPEMDGYSVFHAIKNDPVTANIRFIFFSAHVENKEIDEAMKMGVDGYIRKPFTLEDLMNTLRFPDA